MDTAPGAPQAYPSTPGLYHLTTQAEGQTIYYKPRHDLLYASASFPRLALS